MHVFLKPDMSVTEETSYNWHCIYLVQKRKDVLIFY